MGVNSSECILQQKQGKVVLHKTEYVWNFTWYRSAQKSSSVDNELHIFWFAWMKYDRILDSTCINCN